jgi:hypothetical protein
MFSLIITIISIALVAALALATLYFGGDAFNQGSAKAAAATVVNQASQISGANTLHFLDNQAYAADVTALVDGKYLQSAPNPGSISGSDYAITAAASTITLGDVSLAVCEAVNGQSGATVALDGTVIEDVATATTIGGQLESVQFGCVETAADTFTFVYK